MKTSSLFLLTSYIFLLTSSLFLLPSCTERVSNATNDASLPDIYPDYVDVTIPVGIAPLNFGMKSDDALLVDAVALMVDGEYLLGAPALVGNAEEVLELGLQRVDAQLIQLVGILHKENMGLTAQYF